jgi:predicted CoA-binding protein
MICHVNGDDVIRRIFTEFDHITVVGLSRDPDKEAHAIPARMQRLGYRITPVNPHADVLLGERVYRRLADVPPPVDVVEVFRPSAEAPEIARQAVAAGAKAFWLQLGLRSAAARQICADAGLLYVEDHCMAVDYIRVGAAELRAAR